MRLMAYVSTDEVKAATFSMHHDKAPGLDGLNPTYFHVFWGVVGDDIVKVCQRFVHTGELQVDMNRALVGLIPKVKETQTMANLRPISLWNVLLRILSIVLTNRLKP